ncbi:MAG: carbohydrate kinase family protein [Candidatus Daviesbacteria bacterium]|nr:carbohydrate kinase family protein [Candidatus Daviesbacteria bacterium]
MFDLISIGDAAVDLFFQIHDAQVELEHGTKKLCLKFGDKLPVQEFAQSLGGNNPNNAVGAVRLGLKTAIYLNVGTDLMGKFTLEKLKEEKVDTRYIVENTGMGSNVSALISFKGERTILTYRQDFKYSLPDLEKTRWTYLSSMGKTALEDNLVGQVENYVERVGASLIYNPGPFELTFGVKKFPKLLSLCKLLIVNKEEAEEILGMDQRSQKSQRSQMLKKMLSGLAELGPRMVIITDGKEGSYGFDWENYWSLDIFPAHVVDMTGAGDAFATGVLAGLFYGKNLEEAMRWGACNGASVVEEIGCQKGLLTYDQMQKRLTENSKIIAKLI